ncbi:MAG: sugar nucleotide-binding protein [Mariniphaga sp.]
MDLNYINNKFNKDNFESLISKNILITGANGMLGLAFKEIINLYIPDAKVFALGKNVLNVTDREKVLECVKLKPDYIIHCAALVNADYCEDNEEEAFNIFILGMKNIIELAKITGSKVFYPQSFLIYDGKELPITETTIPNPLCIYGKLKLKSEKMLLEELSGSLVVRMAGFFGGRGVDKNFVGKIIPYIAKIINEGQITIDIGDRVWQPTYTNDLAYNSLVLLANNKSGIYCMASHGEASFFDLTCLIIETLGISNRLKINKVSSLLISKNEKAKRPDVAYIENERLNKEKLDFQRNWRESIAEYLNHPYFLNLFK